MSLVELDDADYHTDDCVYTACRVRESDDKSEWFKMLEYEFGSSYTKTLLNAAFQHSHFGVYKVIAQGIVIGTFIVVLFKCNFADGHRGSALLIEAFVVDKAHQRKGHGGKIFHQLCRQMAIKYDYNHPSKNMWCLRRHCVPRIRAYSGLISLTRRASRDR